MISLLGLIASGYQASAAPPLVTASLEIHYDFTNPSCYPGSGNTVQDLTANNRDLVFVNTPTWNSTYFTFDGVNDYGNIINISSVNTQGAVGYWFKLTDSLVTSLNQRLSGINSDWEFGRLDAAGGSAFGCGPYANVPNGSISADLGGPNETYTDGVSFNNTTWFNLVFTWNVSTSAKSYVNGVNVSYNCPAGNLSRTGTWTVGRSPGNTARYLKANLGWMTYYNRQLTDAELAQNFNATKGNYGY